MSGEYDNVEGEGEEETVTGTNNSDTKSVLLKTMSWEEMAAHTAKLAGVEGHTKFIQWLLSKKEVFDYRPFDAYMCFHAFQIWDNINNHPFDHITIIEGGVGKGKSWIGIQIGAMVSPTFSCRHICWTYKQFVELLQEIGNKKIRGESIQLDEGIMFLYGREGWKLENLAVSKLLTIMRVLHIHLIVCIPNYHRLDTSIKVDRDETMTVIHVYGNRNYKAIVSDGIKILNQNPKIPVSKITLPSTTFWLGKNTSAFPHQNDLNLKSYEELKFRNTTQYIKDMRFFSQPTIENPYVTQAQAARDLHVKDTTVGNWIKKGMIKTKVILGRRMVLRRSISDQFVTETVNK